MIQNTSPENIGVRVHPHNPDVRVVSLDKILHQNRSYLRGVVLYPMFLVARLPYPAD